MVDLLAQFIEEEEYLLSEKIPRKVVVVKILGKKQIIRFVKSTSNENT